MSSTDSNPSTAAKAQTPDKLYTPFAVHLDESPDLLQRIDAATDTLFLVLDAGRQLTAMMAENHHTAALSSLVDSLLYGMEYARDVLGGDGSDPALRRQIVEAARGKS